MNRQTLALCGGADAVDEICVEFYRRVLRDPVLACLFSERSVHHHASRMAAFLKEAMGDPAKPYSSTRGCACGGSKTALQQAHARARACPLRDHTVHRQLPLSTGVLGGRFTETQRQHWLTHMFKAADKCNAAPSKTSREQFPKIFKAWCTFTSGKYGPFARDRPLDVDGTTTSGEGHLHMQRSGGGDISPLSGVCTVL